MNEDYRKVPTPWRLPSFDLRIEMGRYDNTPRELRICNLCMEDNIEDEQHIFYICEYYKAIRSKYDVFLLRHHSVKKLLVIAIQPESSL